MKTPIALISILLLLSVSSSASSIHLSQSKWKGKVAYEEGSQVIKNPKEPLLGEITLELEQVLSIGDEDDENSAFYRGINIAVDNEEHIFVLDVGNCRIQKYDNNGKFITSIGRKGQGPGEFQYPIGLIVDSEGNIYVNDRRRVSIFDKSGKFDKSVPMEKQIYSWGIDKSHIILGLTLSIDYEKLSRTQDIFLFDSRGKKFRTIATYPHPIYGWVKGELIGDYNAYRPYLRLIQTNENYVFYGHSSVYRLYKVNFKGDIDLILEKDEAPEVISQEGKDKVIDSEICLIARHRKIKLSKKDMVKAYKSPKHKPYFLALQNDSLENIYVCKYPKTNNRNQNTKQLCYDLFNKNGVYTYKVTMPKFSIHAINNGFLYTDERDKETGFIKVKKYKIKNWEKIKSSSEINIGIPIPQKPNG